MELVADKMSPAAGRVVTPDSQPSVDQALALEPPWRVIIHNDDVTTFDFVINVLTSIFKLSSEIAEHVALIAHTTGRAHVVTRPKREAETLVAKAHFAARMEDFPLMFTLEPAE
jgi:ATP-dependent Clp protease adaptor protein ClpS